MLTLLEVDERPLNQGEVDCVGPALAQRTAAAFALFAEALVFIHKGLVASIGAPETENIAREALAALFWESGDTRGQIARKLEKVALRAGQIHSAYQAHVDKLKEKDSVGTS
jgi:hypothetical protein